MSDSDELRKREEAEFHDRLRGAALKENTNEYRRLTSNKRFYAIAASSTRFLRTWISGNCKGKSTLDFACGDGELALFAAESGAAKAYGVDISSVSVENARRSAEARGLTEQTDFSVDDCESLRFPDATFDLITVAGVLHHLDLTRAYGELARVLKPGGSVICVEALGHNPLIQRYRRATPHLRTAWETEHIVKRDGIELARRFFKRVEPRFFHLAVLAAVPLVGTAFFQVAMRTLEQIDRFLLALPGIRWQAWQVIFVLSEPRHRRTP